MIAPPEIEAAKTDPAPDTPPPPAGSTRGENILVRVERAFAWLDGLIARWLPPEANPLAHSGAAANFALCVAVASGIALLVWYSPSHQLAYSSLSAIRGRSVGGWVRAVHRYSSDLALLFVLVHAVRVFVARKFSGARWLPWVSGVGLIGLVWFIGWTGYWLVWDQPAQQVAVTSMRLLDGLPIFGEPLGRLYLADRLVPSLLFFVVFFVHMLLPLGIAIGLAIHVLRVSRAKLFPNWKVSAAIGGGLMVAAFILPAPLDAPAQMAVKAASFTLDAWYLTPLALALRLQHAGLWAALFGSSAIAAAIPWLLGRRRAPASYQTVVETSRCHACTQCTQDCPFDAITMIPRTDGKRFPSQAFVDPAKCVGCGVCVGSCDSEAMSLTWFDTRREESRIAAEVASTGRAGGTPWVAFVAGDIDSGFALFAATRWKERLPEYQVHFVPTASWVRPKFVERLLSEGAAGVLVVRDARVEGPARDGNRWVGDRLTGERKPVFRTERAGNSAAWRVVDFDPARPAELFRQAEALRSGAKPVVSGARPTRPFAIAMAGLIVASILGIAVVVPSRLRVDNPAPSTSELVFSFRALGKRVAAGAIDAAEEAKKPVHMRGRSTEKPHRAAVIVRLTIDDHTEERAFRAKGISHDGPALDEWRRPLAAGDHAITIEVITGAGVAPLRWTGTLHADVRRLHVITFEPEAGFRVE